MFVVAGKILEDMNNCHLKAHIFFPGYMFYQFGGDIV